MIEHACQLLNITILSLISFISVNACVDADDAIAIEITPFVIVLAHLLI